MAPLTIQTRMTLGGYAGPGAWRPNDYRHRVLAAAASIAITVMLLVALQLKVPVRLLPGRGDAVKTVIRLLPLTPATPDHVVPAEPEAAPRPRRTREAAVNRAEEALPSTVQPAQHPVEPSPSLSSTEPVPVEPALPLRLQGAEPAEIPASAPLRLDAAVIKAAISRSKGLIQQNAEASGKPVPAGTGSRAEKFSSDLRSAGKNDCLASNEHGSLLALPLIAYAALSGQCK